MEQWPNDPIEWVIVVSLVVIVASTWWIIFNG
jgi:hypothetical protein